MQSQTFTVRGKVPTISAGFRPNVLLYEQIAQYCDEHNTNINRATIGLWEEKLGVKEADNEKVIEGHC